VLEIRAGKAEDIGFLEAMLFEAFFWEAAAQRQAFSVFRRNPEFTKLLAGWGRRGDRALIAEDSGRRIGAAWFRLWTPESHSYGFVDSTTPELGIAVSMRHRRKGIGRALLNDLIGKARADEFRALSLSVNPFNPARVLYESLGFRKVGDAGTSWTLRLLLE
jgi:ribosomal protein S18 acetylase RimI-like enzyme